MDHGVKREPQGVLRHLGSIAVVLLVVVVIVYAAMENRAKQNSSVSQEVQPASVSGAVAALPLPGLEEEKTEVDSSSKEIVNDVLLGNVPKADYSYSFNGKLTDAAVVTRAGDVGRFNDGAYPEATGDVLPMFTKGVEGDAVYLDGSYGIELQGIEALNESYTISFWFRADELVDWSPFLLIGSHLLDEGAKTYLIFNKKTTEEGLAVVPIFNTVDAVWDNSCEIRPSTEQKRCISLNEWNYITICVNADEVSGEDDGKIMGYLYLNSEMIGSGEVSLLTMDAESVHAYLGISCYDELFRASYDEVHIWKQVLNESQISAMYAAYMGNGSSGNGETGAADG